MHLFEIISNTIQHPLNHSYVKYKKCSRIVSYSGVIVQHVYQLTRIRAKKEYILINGE